MGHHNIDSDRNFTGTGETIASGDSLIVAAGVTLGATGTASPSDVRASLVTAPFQHTGGIYGTVISSGGNGFSSSAGENRVDVGVTGSIIAYSTGIYLSGGHNTLTIAGSILAGGYGIYIADSDSPGGNVITVT